MPDENVDVTAGVRVIMKECQTERDWDQIRAEWIGIWRGRRVKVGLLDTNKGPQDEAR